MTIQTYCLKCGKLLRLPDEVADTLVRCPHCGAGVQASAKRGEAKPGEAQRGEAQRGENNRGEGNRGAAAASILAGDLDPPSLDSIPAPGRSEAESDQTLDAPNLSTTAEPGNDFAQPAADMGYAPPILPPEPPMDMRWAWKLAFAAGGVLVLGTVIILLVSVLHRAPWDQAHHDEIMDLIGRAQNEAQEGQPETAYRTYKKMDELVQGHTLSDPELAQACKNADAQRDKMYDLMMAASANSSNQVSFSPDASTPRASIHTPAHSTMPATTQAIVQRPRPSKPKVDNTLLTDEQIGNAISHGVNALLKDFDTNGQLREHISEVGSGGRREGADGLAVYALLQAGRSIQDPRLDSGSPFMSNAINALKRLKLDDPGLQTYCYSFRIQALELSGLRDEDTKKVLASDIKLLLAAGRNGSYGYGTHDPRPADNSNSQYGLLAIWAAAEAGEPIPLSYWRQVQKYWMSVQLKDGQWCYFPPTPKMSMTAAGINALFVTHDFLDPADTFQPVGRPPLTPQLSAALSWLEKGNNCLFNEPGEVGRYGLYGIERVGLASGFKYFGTHDWYREMAAPLVANQRADGSWSDSPIDDSYILLFLSRGRHPVMMNKVRFAGDQDHPAYWANRPRDAANLARYAGRTLEQPFNWQTVPLEVNWTDWCDAPVLYLASHQPPPLTSADEDNLRDFILAGGLLVTQADADSPAFTAWAQGLGTRMFPNYPWTDLPANHLLFNVGLHVKAPPPVRAISNGARLLFVHLPKDISQYWQNRDEARHPEAFDLGVNLFLYATGRSNFRNRLETTYIPAPSGKPADTIKLAEIAPPGENPEPAAWPRFARWFRSQTNFDIQIKRVSLEHLMPTTLPVAHMTGIAAFKPTDEQALALRRYVEAGGIVLIDPCGGPNAFGQSVQTDLLPAAFPGVQPSILPETHPVMRAFTEGMTNLGKPVVRDYAASIKPPVSRDFQIMRWGKGCVIIAPMDITSGLLGTSTWGIVGFDPDYCQAFVRNLMLWAWDGAKER